MVRPERPAREHQVAIPACLESDIELIEMLHRLEGFGQLHRLIVVPGSRHVAVHLLQADQVRVLFLDHPDDPLEAVAAIPTTNPLMDIITQHSHQYCALWPAIQSESFGAIMLREIEMVRPVSPIREHPASLLRLSTTPRPRAEPPVARFRGSKLRTRTMPRARRGGSACPSSASCFDLPASSTSIGRSSEVSGCSSTGIRPFRTLRSPQTISV